MVIKCTLSVPRESADYATQFCDLPSLPEYITKRGPYINERKNQIITLYDFDKSKLAEAWKLISDQLDLFRGFTGFSLSARIVRKGIEFKKTWGNGEIFQPRPGSMAGRME